MGRIGYKKEKSTGRWTFTLTNYKPMLFEGSNMQPVRDIVLFLSLLLLQIYVLYQNCANFLLNFFYFYKNYKKHYKKI